MTTYEGHANAQICVSRLHTSTPYQDKEYPSEAAQHHDTATIRIRSVNDDMSVSREIGGFYYAAGRRGTLTFLNPHLLNEVVPASTAVSPDRDKGSPWVDADAAAHGSPSKDLGKPLIPQHLISGQTLREKIIDASMDVEVAQHAFAVGSLTGDSLVRFAFGGCCLAAGKIMDRRSAP